MGDSEYTVISMPLSQHQPPLTTSRLFFQEYIDAHPETIVLDPLPAIRTLLDRSKSYELIRKIEAYMKGMDTWPSLLMGGPSLWPQVVTVQGKARNLVSLSSLTQGRIEL